MLFCVFLSAYFLLLLLIRIDNFISLSINFLKSRWSYHSNVSFFILHFSKVLLVLTIDVAVHIIIKRWVNILFIIIRLASKPGKNIFSKPEVAVCLHRDDEIVNFFWIWCWEVRINNILRHYHSECLWYHLCMPKYPGYK